MITIPQYYMFQGGRIPYPQYYYPVVMADGQGLDAKPITNSSNWFYTISLPNGNFRLDFTVSNTPEGLSQYTRPCSVVPEFGSLSLMITTISIIGIILIQKRFRF